MPGAGWAVVHSWPGSVSAVRSVAYALCMPARLVVAAAVALVLAGCGGESPGAPPPPPLPAAPSVGAPSVASSSPAPSSAAPSAPATPFVTSPDQAGAFAFVREYYRRLDAAYASGDVRPLAVMRTRTCSCRQAEMLIRSVYNDGMHIVGNRQFIDDVRLGPSGPAFAKVLVTLHGPQSQILKGNVFVRNSSAAAGRALFTLTINHGSWLIDDATQDVRPVHS